MNRNRQNSPRKSSDVFKRNLLISRRVRYLLLGSYILRAMPPADCRLSSFSGFRTLRVVGSVLSSESKGSVGSHGNVRRLGTQHRNRTDPSCVLPIPDYSRQLRRVEAATESIRSFVHCYLLDLVGMFYIHRGVTPSVLVWIVALSLDPRSH